MHQTIDYRTLSQDESDEENQLTKTPQDPPDQPYSILIHDGVLVASFGNLVGLPSYSIASAEWSNAGLALILENHGYSFNPTLYTISYWTAGVSEFLGNALQFSPHTKAQEIDTYFRNHTVSCMTVCTFAVTTICSPINTTVNGLIGAAFIINTYPTIKYMHGYITDYPHESFLVTSAFLGFMGGYLNGYKHDQAMRYSLLGLTAGAVVYKLVDVFTPEVIHHMNPYLAKFFPAYFMVSGVAGYVFGNGKYIAYGKDFFARKIGFKPSDRDHDYLQTTYYDAWKNNTSLFGHYHCLQSTSLKTIALTEVFAVLSVRTFFTAFAAADAIQYLGAKGFITVTQNHLIGAYGAGAAAGFTFGLVILVPSSINFWWKHALITQEQRAAIYEEIYPDAWSLGRGTLPHLIKGLCFSYGIYGGLSLYVGAPIAIVSSLGVTAWYAYTDHLRKLNDLAAAKLAKEMKAAQKAAEEPRIVIEEEVTTGIKTRSHTVFDRADATKETEDEDEIRPNCCDKVMSMTVSFFQQFYRTTGNVNSIANNDVFEYGPSAANEALGLGTGVPVAMNRDSVYRDSWAETIARSRTSLFNYVSGCKTSLMGLFSRSTPTASPNLTSDPPKVVY